MIYRITLNNILGLLKIFYFICIFIVTLTKPSFAGKVYSYLDENGSLHLSENPNDPRYQAVLQVDCYRPKATENGEVKRYRNSKQCADTKSKLNPNIKPKSSKQIENKKINVTDKDSSNEKYDIQQGHKIVLDFRGNKKLIDKLLVLAPIKKEKFEKTVDFNKRLCEETYKLLGKSQKDSIVIGLETSVRYDADKETFLVTPSGGSLHYQAGQSYSDQFKWNSDFSLYGKYVSIGIAKTYQPTSDYLGVTTFGVSRKVEHITIISSVLYFLSNAISESITFKSNQEVARRIESDLRLAVITSIVPPCFVSGQGRDPPTIDYPRDYTLIEASIVGSKNPTWVLYLNSTNEILKHGKFKPTAIN